MIESHKNHGRIPKPVMHIFEQFYFGKDLEVRIELLTILQERSPDLILFLEGYLFLPRTEEGDAGDPGGAPGGPDDLAPSSQLRPAAPEIESTHPLVGRGDHDQMYQ